MTKLIQLITTIIILLGTSSISFAQGNAHTPEQIAAKLKALEAMTTERIKEELKHRVNEDIERFGPGRFEGMRRERIGRYLEEVERAQERSFAEVRDSIERQSGESKQQMEQQLEKAESFWDENIAKIKEIYRSQMGE